MLALLDGNVLDWLAARPAELNSVRQALSDGRLRLLETHILSDELEATTDPVKRAALQAVASALAGRNVATTGFVFDVSRLGLAAIGDDARAASYKKLSVDNPNHAEDALLTLTAHTHGAILVTCETSGGLPGRARRSRRHGVTVMHPSELVVAVDQVEP